jgi:hypothetical protein
LKGQLKVYKKFGSNLKGQDNISFAKAELKLNP